MSTIATETDTSRETFHRAIGYLKGILTGYADGNGYAYHTTKETKPSFEAGFKLGGKRRFSEKDITAIHIIHNRLRNRPPHRGTVDKDSEYDLSEAKRTLRDYIGEGLEMMEGASWIK